MTAALTPNAMHRTNILHLRLSLRPQSSTRRLQRGRLQASAGSGRRRELEERLERLVEEKATLRDSDLEELWSEIQDVTQQDPVVKTEAQQNMQVFLETLFHQLSLRTEGALFGKERVKDLFGGLPDEMVEHFKEMGIWDRLPQGGLPAETLESLQLWTEEEFKVFSADPNLPPPLDPAEEIEKELTLLSAVRKLEDFLRSYPEDPAEVLNMMVAGKLALEVDRDPFSINSSQLDAIDGGLDQDLESLIDLDGIEECLKALEEGEDAPPPDPAKVKVIKGEDPKVLRERLKLMEDFYTDPHRQRGDRGLSKAEYREIKQRWDAFMPDKDPVFFEDISHIRLAPDWPEWMERHFRSMQHIIYVLRAAHIHAKLTEPGKRLLKYNRISLDIQYLDPAVECNGYDAYIAQMEKLEAAGLTTEPNGIFVDCQPPAEIFEDSEIENPWSYTIVVDQHLNLPIPDWSPSPRLTDYKDLWMCRYHDVLDAYEAQMTDDDWAQPEEDLWNQERSILAASMDKIMKKKRSGAAKKRRAKQAHQKEPHESEIASEELKSRLDALKIGLKEGDPAIYNPIYPSQELYSKKKDYSSSGKLKGDFWFEGPHCEAWKHGYFITINATLLYTLDIQAGQVSKIQMRWGAIMGSVLSAEDAEKLYCEVSGVEYPKRRVRQAFQANWKEFEYKPIRQDPVEWFKRNVMGIE